MESNKNRRVVAQSSSAVPNHPQPTTFMCVEHPEGGPDEMIKAKGYEKSRSSGEDAVMKYRTPY